MIFPYSFRQYQLAEFGSPELIRGAIVSNGDNFGTTQQILAIDNALNGISNWSRVCRFWHKGQCLALHIRCCLQK